ncbi:DUF726 domain-containing protein [Nodosilinea sp. LEGE 06152]|uniref:DUF726 domain-containing protein n=1 Tax=Nodosilinea sp. LEGE 06152 TaxID=2777966 RepID=UPI00187E11E6|nr:DUF726 domain-containing protein [Nodosilinea sp. LEGE 06152]MBE9157381.1 DUF726 domain-containing protein [Nodosilinea sp. LEGE 06152]
MDTPWIRQIAASNSSSEAIVVVSGFTTENKTGSNDYQIWIDGLRKAGWEGAIYYFWWDSSNNESFGAVSLGQIGVGLIPYWEKHKRRAKRSGRDYLERLVRNEVYESSISFVGHSLGARVLFFGLRDWSNQSSSRPNRLYLLGGAIPKNRNWSQLADTAKCKIFNIYNSSDWTLKTLYRASSLGLQPCGLWPIETRNSEILNINVTPWIGHSHELEKYLSTLTLLANQGEVQL